MTNSNYIHDPEPQQKWYTHVLLAQDVWAAATDFVKNNPDHIIFIGSSPLDSPTGLNERRCVLFRMTAKKFSDVLGCRLRTKSMTTMILMKAGCSKSVEGKISSEDETFALCNCFGTTTYTTFLLICFSSS